MHKTIYVRILRAFMRLRTQTKIIHLWGILRCTYFNLQTLYEAMVDTKKE